MCLHKYVALLRAINVGGHTVKMADLRTLFEQLAFANVKTFIASGNVIFDTPHTDTDALQTTIERHLRAALGYNVATFLRAPDELAALVYAQPFADALLNEGGACYVAFLQAVPTAAAQAALMARQTVVDEFAVRDRHVFWYCRAKMSESLFGGKQLESILEQPATVRNITTVTKLASAYAPQ